MNMNKQKSKQTTHIKSQNIVSTKGKQLSQKVHKYQFHYKNQFKEQKVSNFIKPNHSIN